MSALPLLLSLTACSQTTLTVLTDAPPGKTAAVDLEAGVLTLSRSVAVALECTEHDSSEESYFNGPCRDFTVTLDDPTLADVHHAHLEHVAGSNGYATKPGQPARTGLVVVGKASGTTTLHVTSRTGGVVLGLVVPAE